ncbi:MAG: Tm-1-like ATP-binding domain-containing protein, partial [Candidatus Methylomirabilales bacterium]
MSDRTVAVIGTLDTKGPEYDYLSAELQHSGLTPITVDTSCHKVGEGIRPQYPCTEVARRAGWDFGEISRLDKVKAREVMVAGATAILQELYASGHVHGLIALGGANGTAMACDVMRAFPIGVPKLVVSVLAAGDPRQDAGTKDIILVNSVTDMSLNRVTKQIISNAAAAMAGMLQRTKPVAEGEKKLQIGASMLGVTQACVLGVKTLLEARGHELMIFHANGIGGVALEDLISRGTIDAVLDVTTNELGNNMLGGVFDAGPNRLEAAATRKIPQIIVPGAVDFINFWGKSIPDRFRDRLFIFHNEYNTLLRTTPEENARLGSLFAEKLNRSGARTVVLLPLRGFSRNDSADGPRGVSIEGQPGAPWYNPEADMAFIQGLKGAVDAALIEIRAVEAHINEPAFIKAVVDAFDETV